MSCFLNSVPGEVASISYEPLSDSGKSILLTWTEPSMPNGTILSYHVVVTLYENVDDPVVYGDTVFAGEELSVRVPNLRQL